ncbi:MAG: DUF1553 domain-containing protein, partial [Planctomycetales bacterium]|nr:DUF1553 domain-containing protein [Planctomycetales bacterium]
RPDIPSTQGPWAQNPIDHFVLTRLQKAGLSPSPPADKRTLIRRVTFDLTGLPPTSAETEAFLNDQSPRAFEQLVDRLLASPAYGEQWGRHWLDVVRYADTAGETGDYPVPLAYKYRDWVIRAFNDDKPYDQFINEQLAGDLIAAQLPQISPDRYAALRTATGFVAISRRFGFDVENYHHLTIQDTIDTLGKAVLGLSLGCAHCHDHKYDPVSREDYYGWYGIFKSTRYSFPGSEEKKRSYDLFTTVPPQLQQEVGSDVPTIQSFTPIYGAIDQDAPADAPLLLRGERDNLGPITPRRNLELLGNDALLDPSSSGRLELAHWLTRPENPLTARVMVNRIWQHHFGYGLVRTENDFGTRGAPPTHPALLDWLADAFRSQGWSVKSMHRLILTSATWQQSSASFPQASHAQDIDPSDTLYWCFPRRRLSAEEIRDAMLSVGGELDRSPGGPHPFPAEETWNFTQHNPFYGVYPTSHRSIYLMQQRLKRHPFLTLFDGADPNASTARRETTTVPTQTLYLMNSDFVHARARSLATRVTSTSGDPTSCIQKLFHCALGRDASAEEVLAALSFLDIYRSNMPPEVAEAASWEALARTMITRNEFLFVD